MDIRERIEAALGFARTCTDKVLLGWPEDRYLYRPIPEMKHAVWVLGHIAHGDDWLASRIGVGPGGLPEGHAALFGEGADLHDDGAYPPMDEVRRRFDGARARLLTGVLTAPDHLLDSVIVEWEMDVANALLAQAWHEGWHAGQLAVIRKSLGLGAIF